MDSDSLTIESANQAIDANEHSPGNRLRYLEPAPKIDVMFDQLEYLLGHQDDECPAGCRECVRLKQVEDSLLQPFRAPRLGYAARE